MKRFASVLMVMVLMTSAIFMACSSSEEGTAKEGDTVKVLYTGTLDDGSVFDSSELHGGDPLEFTVGEGRLLPAFEQAVIGLSINQSTTIHIPADEAYGPYDEELIITVDWSQFEEGFVPEVGEKLYMRDASGQVVEVTVLSVTEAGVVVDANHPLAGEDLSFEITLIEILTSTPTPTPTTMATPTPTPSTVVEYKITGSASKVNVTLNNATGGTEQYSDVPVPFTFTYNNYTDGFLYISAQNQGDSGTVTVTIYVDGEVFDTATSSGAYVIADASGSLY